MAQSAQRPRQPSKVDRLLVEKTLAGDKRAFDLLVSKYQHRVVRLVNRFVYDNASGQDITQEVFIKAYQNLKSFKFESSFYTWLYRITINVAISHYRRNKRDYDKLQVPDSMDVFPNDADSKSFEDAAIHDLQYHRYFDTIQAAINALPELYQKPLVMRELEGHSYEDIAAMLDRPLATIRSQVARARFKLLEQIRAQIFGADSSSDKESQ